MGKCEGHVDAVPQAVDAKPLECIRFQDSSRPPSVINPNLITRDNKLLNKRIFKVCHYYGKCQVSRVHHRHDSECLRGWSYPFVLGTTQILLGIYNPKAFIFYDIDNPQLTLDRIAYSESNPDACEEIFNEPILAHGDETIEKYFSFDFDNYRQRKRSLYTSYHKNTSTEGSQLSIKIHPIWNFATQSLSLQIHEPSDSPHMSLPTHTDSFSFVGSKFIIKIIFSH